MTKDEALDLALEALQFALHVGFDESSESQIKKGDKAYQQHRQAITAIKQARALDKKAENARELGLDYEPVWNNLPSNKNVEDAMRMKRLSQLSTPPAAQPAPVQDPVVWRWHQAPVKTQWGDDMVVSDLAIDKDNTLSVYCERGQAAKVEAMFTPPAQPADQGQSCYCPNCEALSKELAALKAQPAPVQEQIESAKQIWREDQQRIAELSAEIDRLTAAQRQWVGLTLADREQLRDQFEDCNYPAILVDVISDKLKEKNT